MLTLHNVCVRVADLTVLDAISLTVPPGRCIGISGPSGSGKTTLLHAAGMLLRPSEGSVTWQGAVPRDPVRWRRETAGFVFQDFCLVPELSALANVLLPLRFAAFRAGEAAGRGRVLLADMGIAHPDRRAGVLSRGEQQRVAIARAVLNAPSMILADEPTASLDAATGRMVGALLIGAARRTGAALLVVSHDPALLAEMDEVHTLREGRLT